MLVATIHAMQPGVEVTFGQMLRIMRLIGLGKVLDKTDSRGRTTPFIDDDFLADGPWEAAIARAVRRNYAIRSKDGRYTLSEYGTDFLDDNFPGWDRGRAAE